MWGGKQRRIEAQGRRIASLCELLDGHREHIGVLTRNQANGIRRHTELMQVIAMHYATGTSLDQLRDALDRAGFKAELDIALRDLKQGAAT